MPISALRNFLRLETAAGNLLVAAAVLGLLASNSLLAGLYQQLLNVPLVIALGELAVAKPLLLWINDGLMALFFFLIGLEVKREIAAGQLSSADQIVLPAVGALGGFLVPAAIYAAINWNNPATLNGWAIPAATDIAFALGVLALLGSRAPLGLKVFLTSIAIFDDIGAILVIAAFYTSDLSGQALLLASSGVVGLVIINRLGITRTAPYAVLGVAVWVCVLKSGIHATLAGFIVALTIPLRGADPQATPLRDLEHALHPWIAYGVLPLFAFANAGVSFAGITGETFFGTVALGHRGGAFHRQTGRRFWRGVADGQAGAGKATGRYQLAGYLRSGFADGHWLHHESVYRLTGVRIRAAGRCCGDPHWCAGRLIAVCGAGLSGVAQGADRARPVVV